MMKYKLSNYTSISRKKIEEFIKISSPKGIRKVNISIMYDKSGSAYYGEATPYNKVKSIKIWINKKVDYPRISTPKNLTYVGYSPYFYIKSSDEAILSILAHELRHIWQVNVSKQKFDSASLQEYTCYNGEIYYCHSKAEKDACQYAKKVLHKYRKNKKSDSYSFKR